MQKPFNFWRLAWQGFVIGCLCVAIAAMFSCNEPAPLPYSGRVDTVKATVYVNENLIGNGTPNDPIRVNHDPQLRQYKLLEEIRKDIKKLREIDKQDTAYRHNIMQVADTIYYAIVKKKKGKINIHFNKSYTDKKLFVHDIPIDTITP